MKQSTITSTIEQIPFSDLYVSELNPRADAGEDGIDALAENIKEHGLIQNLAGLRDESGKVGIVAGGRRLRALGLLQSEARFTTIAVNVAPDQATAAFWASSENSQREALHPADEIRDYGAMEARGVSVASIAMAYGVTEKHVYRRLALAQLPAPVLDALKADEINLSGAAAFTISDDEKRSLDVLEQVRGTGRNDTFIKRALKPDSVSGTDRRARFVGVDAYKEAGGRVGGDLFTDETLFDSPDVLDAVFTTALEEASKEVREAQGWNWVEPLEASYVCSYSLGLEKYGRIYPVEGELSGEDEARHAALEEKSYEEELSEAEEAELSAFETVLRGDYTSDQKDYAGAYVYVGTDGQLKVSGGFIKPESKKAAIEAGILAASRHGAEADKPKSPISQKLRDDLDRIAKGAHQHAALRDPDLLIDLLAYQLSHSLHWDKPFGITTSDVPNWPSTQAEGYVLDPRLTENPARDMWDAKDLGASFRAFRKKGAEHVRGELTRFLAAQFQGGNEKLAALVAKSTKPNIREVWTPTAGNFFKRVSGPYMVEIWRDLLELAEDHPTVTTFAKLKKAQKADKLEALFGDPETRAAHSVTPEQAARIDAWLPEGMG